MGILRYWGRWICARVAGEVLGVGCGDSELAAQLEREGHRVVEVDPERATALPFEDASFDSVLLVDFLGPWASRERPLAEARRVLRPGGRLILTVPYGGASSEGGGGPSLELLVEELSEVSVKEIAAAGERLCLLAERSREKSRAVVWRRALRVAEERLGESEAAHAAIAASAAELTASQEREERALADARRDVVRLETALAAATHARDLAQEKARLATDGVAQLEARLEREQQANEREQQAKERERAEAEGRAQREKERERAEVEGRAQRELADVERSLADARGRLEAHEGELEHNRAALQEAQAQLTAVRERLGKREHELAARERELVAIREEVSARRQALEVAESQVEAHAAELELAREAANAAERGREEAFARLEVRERHLKTAQLGVESRDRRLEIAERQLAAADRALDSRDGELERLRASAGDRERKLALTQARLEKAQQRADYFRGSLLELREGRAYRLMRILWRLRRPFRRAPREEGAPAAAEGADDTDPAAPSVEETPPAVTAIAERRPAPSSGGRFRVASILDEMSAACFAPECELIPLTLAGWAEQLDEHRPDLLLVESAWNGNDGEWQYRIAQYSRPDLAGLPALRELIDGCRERGIPTAFWNKEDPVHFERFAEAASLFDHVFTTDSRCIERYRELPGQRTVAPLPFAAQPRIHNPTAVVPERSASPCFAGAWYRDRHPDRRTSLAALLDAARPYGLVIYDRSFDTKDGAFGFPDRFAPHVLGKLPYERILDVYKSHRVFLNANSVVDSPTMCSRRVFELAACDTAILSTPGAALSALLGEGVVAEAGDTDAAASALEHLQGDEEERRRRTRAARRAVFANHTYAERLAMIIEAVGLDASSLRRSPFALPGGSGNGANETNGASDSRPWRLILQDGVRISELALADLAAAARFAEADIIGIAPRNGGSPAEHRHVEDLDPRLLLVRNELIAERGGPAGSPEQVSAQLRSWHAGGVRLYAADADLLSLAEPGLDPVGKG